MQLQDLNVYWLLDDLPSYANFFMFLTDTSGSAYVKETFPLPHITCPTYVTAPLCWWLSFPSHQNRLVENRKGFGMEEFWVWIEAPPLRAVWFGMRSWVSSSGPFVSSVGLIDAGYLPHRGFARTKWCLSGKAHYCNGLIKWSIRLSNVNLTQSHYQVFIFFFKANTHQLSSLSFTTKIPLALKN